MTSPRARPLLLALLGVLAIALAAATLNSAVVVDEGFGLGEGSSFGAGSDGPSGPNESSSTPEGAAGAIPLPDLPSFCVPSLAEPGFQIVALSIILVSAFLLYRRHGPIVPILLAVAVGPPVVLVYLFLTACVGGSPPEDSPNPLGGGNISRDIPVELGNATGGGASGSISTPSLILLGALAAVLLAAVAALLVSSDDQEVDARAPTENEEPGPVPEAIGRIAGRAADRIEDDAELDNEVFRAWHEMTTFLDVPNPESSSPGEFADAAVEAGMDRERVTRLTRLFEEVRYGTAEPTTEREERAIDALRQIEDAYSEGET